MKKFVATFKTKTGGNLFIPIHADSVTTARMYAATMENTSVDFWGSAGLKLIDVKEITDDSKDETPQKQ